MRTVSLQKKLKTLALMLIVIFAVIVYERTEMLFSQSSSEEQVAAIWNPIAAFLGIPTSREAPPVDSSDPFANTPDDFANTPDGFGFGFDFDDDLGFGDIPDDPFGGAPVGGTGFAETTGASPVSFSTPTNVSSQTIDNLSPTLLCLPSIISEGEEAIVMYACRDGSATASTSFAQDNAPIGTDRVTPGVSTTYSVECSEGTRATCDVTVAQPALAILTTPKSASRGGTVAISWKTKDTQSCILTSNDPNHRSFERQGTEGEAISPTLFGNTTFFLTCETVSGVIEERSVTVGVR